MFVTRPLFPAAALALAMLVPGVAASQAPDTGDGGPERVKQVIVYGDDPCPRGEGDEILVCARLPANDRYRIPKELRTDPNDPKVQSWALRAEALEYVGRDGTQSCSPTGSGGFTGCFAQIARQAKAERRALLGDATWKDAVAAEREKRLSVIDADSEEIEARVKAEEAAEAEAKAKGAATPAP